MLYRNYVITGYFIIRYIIKMILSVSITLINDLKLHQFRHCSLYEQASQQVPANCNK